MRTIQLAAILATGALLCGCSSAAKTLGLQRSAPDEFQVVSQAPLSMPPDYNLRPPVPGAPRPQETGARAQAQAALYGGGGSGSGAAASSGTDAFLAQAGATGSSDGVRREVDSDYAAVVEGNDTLVNDVLFWRDPRPAATVVDANAEAERLRRARAADEAPNAGESVSRDEGSEAPLEGVFN